MKKILFMAMIAIAFMACGEKNGANLPSKDKAAISAITVDATALVGKDAAAVDKALLAAGFQKADASASAPERLKGKFNAPAASGIEYYVYGIDPKVAMSETEDIPAFNKAIANGSIIVAAVLFDNNKAYQIGSNISVKCAKGDSRAYTDISDGLYKQIPAEALQSKWAGSVDEKNFTKQDEFVAAIAAAENGVAAEEYGYAVTAASAAGYEGFYYTGEWGDPDAETKAAMQKDGYTPYANALVFVVDINVVLN